MIHFEFPSKVKRVSDFIALPRFQVILEPPKIKNENWRHCQEFLREFLGCDVATAVTSVKIIYSMMGYVFFILILVKFKNPNTSRDEPVQEKEKTLISKKLKMRFRTCNDNFIGKSSRKSVF